METTKKIRKSRTRNSITFGNIETDLKKLYPLIPISRPTVKKIANNPFFFIELIELVKRHLDQSKKNWQQTAYGLQ